METKFWRPLPSGLGRSDSACFVKPNKTKYRNNCAVIVVVFHGVYCRYRCVNARLFNITPDPVLPESMLLSSWHSQPPLPLNCLKSSLFFSLIEDGPLFGLLFFPNGHRPLRSIQKSVLFIMYLRILTFRVLFFVNNGLRLPL